MIGYEYIVYILAEYGNIWYYSSKQNCDWYIKLWNDIFDVWKRLFSNIFQV